MKAWELRGFGMENLVLTSQPEPKPGPNEVLVRVRAASLNYRDKLVVEGQYNSKIQLPMIQGADGAGDVVETGANVTRFRPGDRVITHYATTWIDGDPRGDEYMHTQGNTIPGVLAEYTVLNEEALVPLPPHLTYEEAATLPCAALTAWYALVEKGQLRPEQTVVVQGTGGVSLFGMQIASALGAKTIVTSSSDEKLERATALGATWGINYSTTPAWHKAVLDLTQSTGADHILEIAGGKNLMRSISALKPGGHIAVIGLLESFTADLPLFAIFGKQAVLRGYSVGSRKAYERMIVAFSEHRLHPVIDSLYPFHDAIAAYEHLYRGAFGKIVIQGQTA
jgi:NADPH:quinone reductase-like Zn-dependent oxidoreductase